VNLPTPPDDLVELGRIAGAYGVRGWIRVRPHGRPDESALLSLSRAWIRPARQTGDAATWRPVDIVRARSHAGLVLLQVAGCDDREQAEALKGSEIAASRAAFPPTEPGEYYWVDLLGCEVIGQEGAVLGRVLAVEDYGAPHPVLRVGGADESGRPAGKTLLIPFVEPIVGEVDLAARRIVADWAADY